VTESLRFFLGAGGLCSGFLVSHPFGPLLRYLFDSFGDITAAVAMIGALALFVKLGVCFRTAYSAECREDRLAATVCRRKRRILAYEVIPPAYLAFAGLATGLIIQLSGSPS
jgi:hypothetical protein